MHERVIFPPYTIIMAYTIIKAYTIIRILRVSIRLFKTLLVSFRIFDFRKHSLFSAFRAGLILLISLEILIVRLRMQKFRRIIKGRIK